MSCDPADNDGQTRKRRIDNQSRTICGTPVRPVLATLAPFRRVVLVSHVNPDPDSLASMLGIQALLESAEPGKPVKQ